MKLLFCRLLFLLAAGLGMLLLGAVIVFGFGWLIAFVSIDRLIASNMIANSTQYWKFIQMLYVIIIIPPIFIGFFRLLPDSERENVKDGSKALGMALLYVGDIIGKGMLLAIGAYIGYLAFIV